MHPAAPEAARKFINFVNASPTPFHAIQNAAARLESDGGFTKVRSVRDPIGAERCRLRCALVSRFGRAMTGRRT